MSFIFAFFLLVNAQAEQKGLEAETLRRTIQPHSKQAVKCYEDSGTQEAGKLVMHWKINPQGNAEDISVVDKKSTLKNEKVRECMKAEIGTWKFPPPVGNANVEVTYPFVFSKVK